MPKKPPRKPEPSPSLPSQEESSEYSSEDQNAALLTDTVTEKVLATMARIRTHDPSIYQDHEAVFAEDDFERGEEEEKDRKREKKFTYKQMLQQQFQEQEEEDEEEGELAPALEEKKAKQSLKEAISKKMTQDGDDDFLTVKSKLRGEAQEKLPQQKMKQFTKGFKKDSKKVLKQVWGSQEMDQTDLFLKQYILNKKWLSSHNQAQPNPAQQAIDEEDEQRGMDMDRYEAEYNFRFEEPGGSKITQYPRVIENSLRQKSESRKERRKAQTERRREEIQRIRAESQKKKEELRSGILERLVDEQEEDNDWFFCDDCCCALSQNQSVWQCSQCEDYMLCEQCYQLIIHPHKLSPSRIPAGCGPPATATLQLQQLKGCKFCRRKITPTQIRYQQLQRKGIINTICSQCFDDSNLQIKKKYKQIQAQAYNYNELLQNNPQKIKQLTNHAQIQKMIDQYMINQYQDIISDNIKTKFKYINVKPQSYGLSDQQILYGDDQQLNKYVSIKKIVPYQEQDMRLRNNKYKQILPLIRKSVKSNKQLLRKGTNRLQQMRRLKKMQARKEAGSKRREKGLKVVNLSSRQQERNHFVPASRLQSYGLREEEGKQQ